MLWGGDSVKRTIHVEAYKALTDLDRVTVTETIKVKVRLIMSSLRAG